MEKSSRFLSPRGLAITILLCFALLLYIVLCISVLAIYFRHKRIQKSRVVKFEETALLLDSLGGRENIISSSLSGRRLTIVLKDRNLLDKDKLKKIGVERMLEMSEKTILVGEKVPDLMKLLDNTERN
jgi:phosphotransferase system IIB component